MPSVALQILFFLVAGGCVLGIFMFASAGEEKENVSSEAPVQEKSTPQSRRTPNFQGFLSASLDLSKKSAQVFHTSIKQPHDIFVHTREMLGRVRGQKKASVLDRTFDRDSEKSFFLQDIRPSASPTDGSLRTPVKVKEAPKIAQKLQNQFEERTQGEGDRGAENEEEFWLGILRQNPRVAHPYKKLGEIYLKRGNYKEAQTSLAFALKKDPDDQEIAGLLAEAKEKRAEKRNQE